MIKTIREIWVRFENYENFCRKEGEFCSLLGRAPGECVVKVYLQASGTCKEMTGFYADERRISLLTEAFGAENVVVTERKVRISEQEDFCGCYVDNLKKIADALQRIAGALEGQRYGNE